MGRLQGKVALITGGGSGIGAAAARIFCAEGAAVVLVDRDADALEETAAAIRGQMAGARVATYTAEVADEAQAPHAVAYGIDAFGRLDVLVNNAAMRNTSAIADATPAEWQAIVGVNVVAANNYCRAALPELRRSGQGSIINVSSCYAVLGRKGMGLYDATKAALLSLTRTLAFEEAPHHVRSNAVCAGGTLTPFHINRGKARGRTAGDMMAERKDNSLIGRWGTPEEIAYPILWLASDEASYITGASLMVDGGVSIM
jgi:meso-butanediol dehydrogenase/(S,S)-butanediol dehydrogenase/diacetyl reductase